MNWAQVLIDVERIKYASSSIVIKNTSTLKTNVNMWTTKLQKCPSNLDVDIRQFQGETVFQWYYAIVRLKTSFSAIRISIETSYSIFILRFLLNVEISLFKKFGTHNQPPLNNNFQGVYAIFSNFDFFFSSISIVVCLQSKTSSHRHLKN